jgi:beta-galactosidase
MVVEWPRLCVWRAPTQDDGPVGGWRKEAGLGMRRRWERWGLDRLECVDADESRRRRGDATVVVARRVYRGARGHEIVHGETMTTTPDGRITFDERVDVPTELDDLPRVGVVLTLAPGYERLTWFGRGPHESYADRKSGARVGIWESTVTDQYVPYVVPQEHGSHADTRWFRLTDRRGRGIEISAESSCSFSASHFAVADLTAARTTAELEPRHEVFVHVDAFMRGLGSASCGPEPLPRYRSGGGRYHLRFELMPIASPPTSRRGQRP